MSRVREAVAMADQDSPLRWSDRPGLDPDLLARIDTSVPHPARVYDYWLGGKDNFEADRKVAEAAMAATPGVVEGRGRTAGSSGARSGTSPSRESTSSSTSAPASPPRATPTRWRRP